MTSNTPSREEDEWLLGVLDLWDSGDMKVVEIRRLYGLTNSAIQGLVGRCLRKPDKQHPCQCVKPENKDGGMARGWWR